MISSKKRRRRDFMLALARKVNESIIINDNVEVAILEIKGDQVKIGISAPKSVPVYRKELYVQIQEANKEAVNMASPESLSDLLK
jgi:carbon storage regulator